MKPTPHGDAMTLLLILAFACVSHFASGRTHSHDLTSRSTAAAKAARLAGFDMSDYDPGYLSGGYARAFFDGTEMGVIERVAEWDRGR